MEFTCTCPSGFRGKTCEARDKCHPNPCHHDGICETEGLDYVCTCSSGWTGDTCEDKDRCRPNPCDHGGICISRINNYICHCPADWMGKTCEISAFNNIASASGGSCATTRWGCCPDGKTPAQGPGQSGCPERFRKR
ncbi:delta-like protein 1 [Dendronephthya gigantea]|uniref:delta-like protein 1 n=1 Tax=Dendronephthya gigantea TaxID=151771 RepID=UPI00106CEFBD|nr:delta-like protein 1 [Dendronephthya gigantea]